MVPGILEYLNSQYIKRMNVLKEQFQCLGPKKTRGFRLTVINFLYASLLPLQVPEWCLDHWHPSEKAMYPDYFAKREQWKKLRAQSWDREVLPVAFHTSDRCCQG